MPDAERVAAGQEPARIDQLFELIRLVNPTGRALGEAERARAYQLKARLQSLLIERFGEQLTIHEVPGSAGILGLRHRTYDKDACHVLVEQLSPMARSWVRWQMDTAGEKALDERDGGTRPGRGQASAEWAGDVLDQGERLLASYDFDGAQRCFAAGMESAVAGERLRAARLQLALLVEQLSDDVGALALQSRLDVEASQDPDIRCLLALACARSGLAARAAHLLGPLAGERAEAAAAALAAAALTANELGECERWAARVPPQSPFRGSVMATLQVVRERRVEAGKSLEMRLREMGRGGEDGNREDLARELLTLDPDNAVARAVLRELAEARYRRVRLRMVADARLLLESGDVSGARAAHAALPVGADGAPELLAAIVAAEARARTRAREARLQEVVSHLGGGVDEATVVAWWSCDAEMVDAIRQRDLPPEARWLVCFTPERKGGAAAVAAAVKAIAAAQACGDPEQAARLVAEHRAVIEHSPAGRAWLAGLEAELREFRARRASDALREARDLIGRDPPEALARLQRINVGHLPAEDRPSHGTLMAALVEECAVAAAEEQIRTAIERGDLFAARAATIALQHEKDTPARRAQIDELERALAGRWIEVECAGDEAMADVNVRLEAARSIGGAEGLVDGILVAEQSAGRIFVREIHLDSAQNRSWILTPTEPFDLLHIHVDGDVLWLVSRQSVLRFDRGTNRFLDLKRFVELARVRNVEGALPIPGTSKMWVVTRDVAWLVDVPRWCVEKRIEECQALFPLWGGNEPAVVHSRHLVDYVSATGAGRIIRRYVNTHVFLGAASRPCGDGAAVLRKAWLGRHAPPMLRLGAILPAGAGFGEIDLGSVTANAPAMVASSKVADRVFVVAELLDQGTVLVCAEVGHRGVCECWRVAVPGHMRLFGDAGGDLVHALVDIGGNVEVIQLTAASLEQSIAWQRLRRQAVGAKVDPLPWRVAGVLDEVWLGPDLAERTDAYRDLLPMLPADELRARTSALLAGDLDLVSLTALHRSGALEGQEEGFERAVDPQRSPGHALLRAEAHARAGRFDRALTCLDLVLGDSLDPPARRHAHHLRTFCHLAVGDEAAARTELALASASLQDDPVTVALREWLDVLTPGAASGGTAALLAKMAQADEHIAAGRFQAACEILDESTVWMQGDVQVMARLAAAWLGRSVAEPCAAWRKRLALTKFVELASGKWGFPWLLLGRRGWSSDRLETLVVRAREWLGPFDGAVVEQATSRNLRTEASDPVLSLVGSFGTPTAPVSIRLLLRRELEGFFEPFIARLCAQAQACWARERPLRLVGFVVPVDQAVARGLGLAGEHLLGVRQEGQHLLLAMPLAAAVRRLARWPVAISALLTRTLFQDSYKQFPLAVLRDGEVGFGNIID